MGGRRAGHQPSVGASAPKALITAGRGVVIVCLSTLHIVGDCHPQRQLTLCKSAL